MLKTKKSSINKYKEVLDQIKTLQQQNTDHLDQAKSQWSEINENEYLSNYAKNDYYNSFSDIREDCLEQESELDDLQEQLENKLSVHLKHLEDKYSTTSDKEIEESLSYCKTLNAAIDSELYDLELPIGL